MTPPFPLRVPAIVRRELLRGEPPGASVIARSHPGGVVTVHIIVASEPADQQLDRQLAAAAPAVLALATPGGRA